MTTTAREEEAQSQDKQHEGHHNRKLKVAIDDGHFEFETPVVNGLELMERVRKKPCRYALVQVIPHADDQFIDPTEKVDLAKAGVEKFVTVLKDIVQIQVDGEWVEISRGSHPINDIKEKAGIDLGYRLALETNEIPKLKDLPEGSNFEVKGCEIFESRPPAGGAS